MTEREIYTSILDETFDLGVLKEFAEKKLAQMDSHNEKAKERAAARRNEGDELLEVVYAYVTEEPQSREDIFIKMTAEGHDVTAGKIGYRLTNLWKNGRIEKAETIIPGVDGTKPRKIMVYSRP